jgi:hypothetical protein
MTAAIVRLIRSPEPEKSASTDAGCARCPRPPLLRDEPGRIVKTLVDVLPSGSYVTATHGSAEAGGNAAVVREP